ncbi:hypothetical protein H7F50_17560 [Novosphingobium flavum]|uniref:hypothetical protein n=1 Tax=Novosphingobium aerophilum TaxID=2839843 RepID=UPI001639520A|nr:hypothetical protein [Novosphingobium aerophilum]MBC2663550.1 hypothetical protein [Novosphingobium aerophilum]
MRTNLEFRAATFLAEESDDGVQGEIIARYLADRLPDHGFTVDGVSAEDWGWRVSLQNAAFPLWIGCGHYQEFPDGVLCFIEPSRPFVRRWFKKIATGERVEDLAKAVEAIVRVSGRATDIRWWTQEENVRG